MHASNFLLHNSFELHTFVNNDILLVFCTLIIHIFCVVRKCLKQLIVFSWTIERFVNLPPLYLNIGSSDDTIILTFCVSGAFISLCKYRPPSLIVILYLTVLEVTKIKCGTCRFEAGDTFKVRQLDVF